MKSIKSYKEAVEFIGSLANIAPPQKNRTRKTAEERLRNVKNFLRFLKNPEKKLKVIHIAGTSGKGSVTAMLHSILKENEKKVGSYTSPHTTTYCERIKAGDKYISESELVEATNFLKNKMDKFVCQMSNVKCQMLSLNFFEFSFCLAIYYFSKKNCEYAVIETGCGGRYDNSNAIEKPIYTIITNIGRDHLDAFGSLENIAKEKAGIIKRGVPILTGEQNNRWLEVFRKESRKKNKESRIKNIDYRLLKKIRTDLDGTAFEYRGDEYKLKLIGEHQSKNAALAIECAKDLKIKYDKIEKGLSATFYPARMEVISKNPTIIIDGAHNEDKIKALVNTLTAKYCPQKTKKYLIFAMAKNKEFKKITLKLFDFFDATYITRFKNPFRKAATYNDFKNAGIFAQNKNNIYYRHYAKDALFDIFKKLKNNDLLVITGSIFLAGELREYWCSEEKILKQKTSKL